MRISDWSSDVCSSDLFLSTIHCASPNKNRSLSLRSMIRSVWHLSDRPVASAIAVSSQASCGKPITRFACPRARTFPVPPTTHGHDRNLESRSEEHTSELQSLIRISYAVFCLQQKQ